MSENNHDHDVSAAEPEGVTPQLDTVEARVLGCLIEKEKTTPEQFPLTANAVVVACNQKTSREPVMELEPGAVGHALRTLEDKRLVRVIHGSRALRYDQRCDDVYSISPEQRIVLALLMLRGPQTAGELLQRSERMHRFHDAEQIRSILERLSTRSPPLTQCLGRGSGQREDRYVHLLCGPVSEASLAAATTANNAQGTVSGYDHLVARIQTLEAQVAHLSNQIEQLITRE